MVGFVSEPTIEEEDISQVSKLKISKETLDAFEPKSNDLAFADSFLDFDSIEDWFEESPNRNMTDSGKNVSTVAEKAAETVGDQIVQGSDLVVDGSKPIEGGSGCAVKLKVEEGEGEKVGKLGCSIEEEMGKVSLVGGLGSDSVDVKSEMVSGEDKCESGNGVKSEMVSEKGECESCNGVKSKIVNDESESASESESSSSSSYSSSSSSDEDDDDDSEEEEEDEKEKEVEEVKMEVKREVDMAGEIEEGEIRDVEGKKMVDGDDEDDDGDGGDDVDEMVAWSDVEDEDAGDAMKGPIKSKNEVKVLPPVPPVNVTLQPYHQTQPVGNILSIIGTQVIVEGVEKHNPLNEDSILWITESRSPLGLVDEIFGPVKNPYYIVRYNTENEVPDGIHEGTLISFVPEFANHVLHDKNLYRKGYDASGENDEEVTDEAEFSDDEKEAEYKKMQKMVKRGMNDQRPGNKPNRRKKGKDRDGTWKNGKPSLQKTPLDVGQLPPPNQTKHHVIPIAGSLDLGNISSSFGIGHGFAGGTGLVPPFPQPAQTTGFAPPSNPVWTTAMPFQQPTNGVFPTNGMQWLSRNNLQQPPFQMPMPNFQQQLDPSQRPHSNFALPGGQSNFTSGPSYPTWQGVVGQNVFNQTTFGMGLQGQHGQGSMPGGLAMEQNYNLQPLGVVPSSNIQAVQQFNLGASSSRGRKPYHRGGGRFAGGRGRQQSK